MIYLFALIIAVVCAVAAEQIAQARGRSPLGYGMLGFLLGPLGLIAAVVTPPNAQVLDARRLAKGVAKRCPACREVIRADARACPHCQHQLSAEELANADAEVATAVGDEAAARRSRAQQNLALVAVIVLGVAFIWWEANK